MRINDPKCINIIIIVVCFYFCSIPSPHSKSGYVSINLYKINRFSNWSIVLCRISINCFENKATMMFTKYRKQFCDSAMYVFSTSTYQMVYVLYMLM